MSDHFFISILERTSWRCIALILSPSSCSEGSTARGVLLGVLGDPGGSGSSVTTCSCVSLLGEPLRFLRGATRSGVVGVSSCSSLLLLCSPSSLRLLLPLLPPRSRACCCAALLVESPLTMPVGQSPARSILPPSVHTVSLGEVVEELCARAILLGRAFRPGLNAEDEICHSLPVDWWWHGNATVLGLCLKKLQVVNSDMLDELLWDGYDGHAVCVCVIQGVGRGSRCQTVNGACSSPQRARL